MIPSEVNASVHKVVTREPMPWHEVANLLRHFRASLAQKPAESVEPPAFDWTSGYVD